MGVVLDMHAPGLKLKHNRRSTDCTGRVEGQLLPADPLQQSETLRQTRQYIAEAWRLREESRRIQRDYEERQRKIEELIDGLGI